MKKYLFTILTIFLTVVGCTKFPIDEDGLLITDREDCYISNLELLGADQRSVLTEKLVVIDEEKLTISAIWYGFKKYLSSILFSNGC